MTNSQQPTEEKRKNKKLLTDEELRIIYNWWASTNLTSDSLIKRVAEKQLSKASPIIRKETAEEIFEWIEKHKVKSNWISNSRVYMRIEYDVSFNEKRVDEWTDLKSRYLKEASNEQRM